MRKGRAMTDPQITLSKIEEELYLCEKMALLMSETGSSNGEYQDDAVAQHFRAIEVVSRHLADKIVALRMGIDEIETAQRAAKGENHA